MFLAKKQFAIIKIIKIILKIINTIGVKWVKKMGLKTD